MYDNKMIDLKKHLEKITDSLSSTKVIYLDYPVHTNGGDQLIFLGTLKFFNDNNLEVVYAASCHNYNMSRIEKLLNDDPEINIILHGGGNFGDLYDMHQNFRRLIFKAFSSANVLLFPQTAFYNDEKNMLEDKNLISIMPRVTFFARDQNTANIFEELGAKAILCPDIAHQLLGTFPKAKASIDEPFNFLRKDIESIGSQEEGVDWKDILSKKDKVVIRLIVNIQKRTTLCSQLLYKLWSSYSHQILNRLSFRFQQHSSVRTSRLHGHIFSCLLERESVVIDNSYGKNSRYINCWTKDVSYYKGLE